MIVLRNFDYNDIPFLQVHGYEQYSCADLQALVDEWNSKVYDDSYFEMFAIDSDNAIVGYASLYQQSESIVSCGIEIYPAFQRKGYAAAAYIQMLAVAKDSGYKIAVAQVLVDNAASIALHKKVGFKTDSYEYVNQKGNKVCCFIKAI